jgi:hypothetical protein
MKMHWLIYFWHILVGTNLAMFFLSAVLGRKDLMLLNAVSMFSCLFMAHVSQHYNPLKKNDPDQDQDNE